MPASGTLWHPAACGIARGRPARAPSGTAAESQRRDQPRGFRRSDLHAGEIARSRPHQTVQAASRLQDFVRHDRCWPVPDPLPRTSATNSLSPRAATPCRCSFSRGRSPGERFLIVVVYWLPPGGSARCSGHTTGVCKKRAQQPSGGCPTVLTIPRRYAQNLKDDALLDLGSKRMAGAYRLAPVTAVATVVAGGGTFGVGLRLLCGRCVRCLRLCEPGGPVGRRQPDCLSALCPRDDVAERRRDARAARLPSSSSRPARH